MEFRTEVFVKPALQKIDLKDVIMTMGSCFADEIGAKLTENKFKILANPFGTIYNPTSIFQLLDYAMARGGARSAGFLQRDGASFHHDFHSSWFDKSQEVLKTKIRAQIELVSHALKDCKVLIITWGTAWCYELIKTQTIVANCHKLPQSDFNKFLLTQKAILTSFEVFHRRLMQFNPSIQIILTVSPVRHIKDTLELNSVSKSILRLTCHTLAESYSNVEYFPAYEIMMDDLRDYRFYKSDLIHPSPLAIDYIWDKFSESYFNDETKGFIKEWIKIKSAIEHKPFQSESEKHHEFLKNTLLRLTQLEKKINVREEIELLQNLIRRSDT